MKEFSFDIDRQSGHETTNAAFKAGKLIEAYTYRYYRVF